MDLKQHIGLKIKAARRRKGLTQEQLAEAVGRAVETISNIERGHVLTGLDTLERIAGVLGVPLSLFFEAAAETRPAPRARREAEEKLREIGASFTNDDLRLAVSVLAAIAKHRGLKIRP